MRESGLSCGYDPATEEIEMYWAERSIVFQLARGCMYKAQLSSLFFSLMLLTCSCQWNKGANQGESQSQISAFDRIFVDHICSQKIKLTKLRSVDHNSTWIRRPELIYNLSFVLEAEDWRAFSGQHKIRTITDTKKRQVVSRYMMKYLSEKEKVEMIHSGFELRIDADLNDSRDPMPLCFAFLQHPSQDDPDLMVVYARSLPRSVLVRLN